MPSIARLPERSTVAVTGADAEKLLQGIITGDLERLRREPAIHAALLSPQGKILFEFMVVAIESGFKLETSRARAAELVKRLGFYKLRAAVQIVDRSAEEDVYATWGDGGGGIDGAYADPRLIGLGYRFTRPSASSLPDAAPAAAYHAHRIALGVPEADLDYVLGDTFPHEACFDVLGGVAFDKGCFIGQEVASRMQHRGGGRKRVVLVEGQADLVPNAPIRAGTTPLGSIGSVNGQRALALVRLDRAAEALCNGTVLTAAGIAISLIKPAWASFDMAATRTEAR